MAQISLFKRHLVTIFFLLTILITWGAILIVVAPYGIPGTPDQVETLLPLLYLAMLLGPSVAGLVCIGAAAGRAGMRDLVSRIMRWRVGMRWYLIALLTAPVIAVATLIALRPVTTAYPPALLTVDNPVMLVFIALVTGLVVGLFEEIGWTGFAVPQLRQGHGLFTTGVTVGVVWGVWHLPLFLWTSGDATGTLDWALFLPALVFCLGILPAYRVLMVWVYDQTASLLLAILMHAALTGGVALLIMPPEMKGGPLVAWYLLIAGILWGAAALVAAHRMQGKSQTLIGAP